jgi:hypothetical protein
MQSISGDEPLDAYFVVLPGSAQNDATPFRFPNGFWFDLDNGTLHDVVSYQDPVTCKISSENICWLPTFWPFRALASIRERPKWQNIVYIFSSHF